jgi:hypothetical protein
MIDFSEASKLESEAQEKQKIAKQLLSDAQNKMYDAYNKVLEILGFDNKVVRHKPSGKRGFIVLSGCRFAFFPLKKDGTKSSVRDVDISLQIEGYNFKSICITLAEKFEVAEE